MMLATSLRPVMDRFDPQAIKAEFPVFANNPGLVFLDTAASAQKPKAVIDGLADYYRTDYANVHRGVYGLSQRSTDRFEQARMSVAAFIGAKTHEEIVFVRGATEAINLVAYSWGLAFLRPGDRVLISQLEHHANIVPWQLIKAQTGIELVVCPLDANNALDMEAFSALLDERVKLVAITHVANVTGHITPVETIVKLAHAAGAKVLIDGCQAVPRIPVNVANLDCDFYVFSGHKCYGPTGIGVLYAKRAVLDSMPPWQGGGDMILTVTFEKSTFQAPPHRFEAGTPDISGAIALDLALGFLQSVGMETIYEHELALTQHAIEKLTAMPGVNVVAAGDLSIGAVSFTVDGVHPHDLATIFDDCNVAVRAGHHCAQPLMDTLGLAATARASFGIYNDEADVEALAGAIRTAQKMFGV